MTDDDKALVERLRDRKLMANTDPWLRADDLCVEAADRIEAQAAETERLREAIKDMFPLTDNRESYADKYYRAIRIARAALGETE